MPDRSVMTIDQMATSPTGLILARASLGVTSFGMQISDFPPGFEDYPTHNHATMTGDLAILNDGQEEVYIPLSGRGILFADGEKIALEPGTMVRCGPTQTRKVITAESPLTLLTIGGIPGRPYSSPAAFELEG